MFVRQFLHFCSRVTLKRECGWKLNTHRLRMRDSAGLSTSSACLSTSVYPNRDSLSSSSLELEEKKIRDIN